MSKTINARITHKIDTQENWEKAVNFVPLKGEWIFYDKDENNAEVRLKIGDGVSTVNELSFQETQPDWNQSNKNANDYIKNRPFYEDWEKVITWDGNTENKDILELKVREDAIVRTLYKVSDFLPPLEEVDFNKEFPSYEKGKACYEFNSILSEYYWYCDKYITNSIEEPNWLIIYNTSFDLSPGIPGAQTAPSTGIYFYESGTLKIGNGIKQIDEKFIPDIYIKFEEKGAANGLATLDDEKKIPLENLPDIPAEKLPDIPTEKPSINKNELNYVIRGTLDAETLKLTINSDYSFEEIDDNHAEGKTIILALDSDPDLFGVCTKLPGSCILEIMNNTKVNINIFSPVDETPKGPKYNCPVLYRNSIFLQDLLDEGCILEKVFIKNEQDWEQIDENSNDFIKNKPFGDFLIKKEYIFEINRENTSEEDSDYNLVCEDFEEQELFVGQYYTIYSIREDGSVEQTSSFDQPVIYDSINNIGYIDNYNYYFSKQKTTIKKEEADREKFKQIKLQLKYIKTKKIDSKYLNQSNWNQNDETASDYIQNRPFYTLPPEHNFNFLIPHSFEDITWDGQREGLATIHPGKGADFYKVSDNFVNKEKLLNGYIYTSVPFETELPPEKADRIKEYELGQVLTEAYLTENTIYSDENYFISWFCCSATTAGTKTITLGEGEVDFVFPAPGTYFLYDEAGATLSYDNSYIRRIVGKVEEIDKTNCIEINDYIVSGSKTILKKVSELGFSKTFLQDCALSMYSSDWGNSPNPLGGHIYISKYDDILDFFSISEINGGFLATCDGLPIILSLKSDYIWNDITVPTGTYLIYNDLKNIDNYFIEYWCDILLSPEQVFKIDPKYIPKQTIDLDLDISSGQNTYYGYFQKPLSTQTKIDGIIYDVLSWTYGNGMKLNGTPDPKYAWYDIKDEKFLLYLFGDLNTTNSYTTENDYFKFGLCSSSDNKLNNMQYTETVRFYTDSLVPENRYVLYCEKDPQNICTYLGTVIEIYADDLDEKYGNDTDITTRRAVNRKFEEHDNDNTAHKDIRDAINDKIGKGDIVDNLETNETTKPLSAAQGVELKRSIDGITVPTQVSQLTNDSGYITATELDKKDYLPSSKLPEKLPADGGNADTVDGKHASDFAAATHTHNYDEIKNKPTIVKQGYTNNETWYYPLGKMVIDNAGNYGNLTFSGRLGGWTNSGYATYDIMLMNRANYTGDIITSTVTASGQVSNALNICDIVVAKNDDLSHTVYLKCKDYFLYNFDWTAMQHSVIYDGTYTTTEPANIIWKLSTAPKTILSSTGELSASGGIAASSVKGLDLPANVKDYGAKGDGSTDDTIAFQNALAENRTVRVPDGEYILSGPLRIRANCSLQLSQAAVLIFTQTSGNCISMGMSSSIQGNHATIKVPYEFTGNVVCVLSSEDSDYLTVPPFQKWDPMWKAGRYVTDLNVVKPDYRGFNYSIDGNCNGTAFYIEANKGTNGIDFVWGLIFSGLKIAGGFNYGIRCKSENEGWAHDMRIEAFMDCCEIGVSLEKCNCAYISAIVQPRVALTEDGLSIPYAKHGIQIIDSTNVDISGSKVWDWNGDNTLYTSKGEFQHIALKGNCRGTIMSDYLYYEMPEVDIRDLIYTDNPDNLEKMVIINEPFTRWFKSKDGLPYYNDGTNEKQVALTSDFNGYFDDSRQIAHFTNSLAKAIDKNGAIFHDKGYVDKYYYWNDDSEGSLVYDETNVYYGCTGYITCSNNCTIYAKDLSFSTGDNICRITLYDSSFNKISHTNRSVIISDGGWHVTNYIESSDGFQVTIQNADNVAYATFNFDTSCIGPNPIISINQEITYSQEASLKETIKIDGSQVINSVPSADTIDGYHIRTASEGDTGLEGYITFIV